MGKVARVFTLARSKMIVGRQGEVYWFPWGVATPGYSARNPALLSILENARLLLDTLTLIFGFGASLADEHFYVLPILGGGLALSITLRLLTIWIVGAKRTGKTYFRILGDEADTVKSERRAAGASLQFYIPASFQIFASVVLIAPMVVDGLCFVDAFCAHGRPAGYIYRGGTVAMGAIVSLGGVLILFRLMRPPYVLRTDV